MPIPDPDDLETLMAARAGDAMAGTALVERHGAAMMRTAWNVTGRFSSLEVEDVVQEAFIAALTTGSLPTGDVGSWLRSITARKALDGLRQSVRRRERALGDPGEGEPEPVAPDRAETPLATIVVHRALAALSPLDRAVLTLVDLEGFTMAEAAKAIGSTVVAVKWRAVRARRRLRTAIEGASFAPGSDDDGRR
jgi:RNA polymerase sigma-70 factor (ECF subfamily)